MLIGEILRKLRKKKKLTQEQIAKKLNIQRSTYSNYEIGKRIPDVDTIKMFADFFDCSTDYILGKQENNIDEVDRQIASRINELPEDEKQMIMALLDKFNKS